MGTKASRFHPRVRGAGEFQQPVEPDSTVLRRRGTGETGAHAGPGVRREGELTDQQQLAAGVGKRAVHLAGIIGEYAVAQQSLQHASGLRFTVIGLHCHQRQQAGTNGTDGLVVDIDAGREYALDQGNHGVTRAMEQPAYGAMRLEESTVFRLGLGVLARLP